MIFLVIGSILLSGLFSNAGIDKALNAKHHDNTIVVTGTGVVNARPDIAIIHLSVISRDENAQQAQAENAQRTSQLVTTLKNTFNLPDTAIQTTSYTVSPEYKKTQPPTLLGYVVRHSLSVRIEAIDTLGMLVDTAVQAGADSIDFIQYELSNPEPYQTQALQMAMSQARAKAQAIAESFGQNVIRVIHVSQGQFFYEGVEQEAQQDGDTEILPGFIRITAVLNVEFLF